MYRLIDKVFDYFNTKSPVLIHTPRTSSFGNCAEELFFGLLKASRENKTILFLYPQNLFSRKLIANHKLFHFHSPCSIQNRVVCYLTGWLLTGIFVLVWTIRTVTTLKRLRRILQLIWSKNSARPVLDFYLMHPSIGRSTLWKPVGVDFFSWETVKEQNWRNQFDEYVPPRLMNSDHRYAEQLRTQMGIPLADWFVCLHVRGSGDRSYSNIGRSASIQNYIKGIEVVTAAGGWVVRLGDPSMTPLPAMERVIDYPHTRYKSELMDIYLISQCRFFIGTTSGPSEVANLFNKPTILVNVAEWSMSFPIKKGDLLIIRHVFSRLRNRFLSIKEIMEESSTSQVFSSASSEYMMVENTPEEISDVIEEFLAKAEDYEYSQLQEAFNQMRRLQIYEWLSQMEGDVAFGHYRIASRCDSAAGTLGEKYLEQNWITDDLEKSSFRPLIASSPNQP